MRILSHVTYFVYSEYVLNQGKSISIVTGGTWSGRPGFSSFFLLTEPRSALGPTQPPIQWVPRVVFAGVKSAEPLR